MNSIPLSCLANETPVRCLERELKDIPLSMCLMAGYKSPQINVTLLSWALFTRSVSLPCFHVDVDGESCACVLRHGTKSACVYAPTVKSMHLLLHDTQTVKVATALPDAALGAKNQVDVDSNNAFVLYHNEDCAHCRQFMNIWKAAKKGIDTPTRWIEVDTRQHPTAAAAENIDAVPTILLHTDGGKIQYPDAAPFDRSIDALHEFVKLYEMKRMLANAALPPLSEESSAEESSAEESSAEESSAEESSAEESSAEESSAEESSAEESSAEESSAEESSQRRSSQRR